MEILFVVIIVFLIVIMIAGLGSKRKSYHRGSPSDGGHSGFAYNDDSHRRPHEDNQTGGHHHDHGGGHGNGESGSSDGGSDSGGDGGGSGVD
jgi:hypothetical protein